jgi:hypothetical protein
MAGVGLQFHAEPRELLGLAEEWALAHGLYVALERFFPEYEARVVDAAGLCAEAARMGSVDRVVLGTVPLRIDASSALEMVELNPGRLTVQLGMLGDEGLRESCIAGAARDEPTLRVWRRLVRRARTGMHKGATVVGVTGIEVPRPSHRHTEGAHRLAARGVTMLALAGANEYRFDDVTQAGSDGVVMRR